MKPPLERPPLTSELEELCAPPPDSDRAECTTEGAAELSRVGGGRLGASIVDDLVVGDTVIDAGEDIACLVTTCWLSGSVRGFLELGST